MSTKSTNAQQFVADLGAGTFANQLGAAISIALLPENPVRIGTFSA